MNIGLIGSGGREHALCKKIYESKISSRIICFPGNPGTSEFATNVEVNINDFKEILKLIKLYKIKLVIIGPEEPLVLGIVDFLKKNKIQVFGPNKFASKLEGSKSFMKKICQQNNIPTAKFKICDKKSQVIKFLNNCKLPLVVKADGLAAGKGVTICKSRKKVLDVSSEIFNGKFKSSKKLVLEEFLKGEEASYFLVVDNNNFKFFGTAQDHKRVKENDKGPNTGGMGAYSPTPLSTSVIIEDTCSNIIEPTLKAMKEKGYPYTGFLYVGLMIVNNNPYVIEYNVRMGDPETQVVLPLLDSSLFELLYQASKGSLLDVELKISNQTAVTIVLASKGYPRHYEKGVEIKNNKVKLFLIKKYFEN